MKFYTAATILSLLAGNASAIRTQSQKKTLGASRRLDDTSTWESDTEICTINHDIAQSAEEVDALIEINFDANDWWNKNYDVKTGSYFKITVYDEPWAPKGGSVTNDGWCVDYGRLAKTRRAVKTDIFTTYDGDLHYDPDNWKKNAVDKPELLPNVAYLINHWNVGDKVAACSNDVVGWLEMQTAIWTIIDDETNHDSSPYAGGNYVSKRNECVMRHISNDALTNGGGYVPDCTDPEEQIPLIYIIDAEGSTTKKITDGSKVKFEEGDIIHQVVISETNVHSIADLCQCTDKTQTPTVAPTEPPTEAPTDPPAPDQPTPNDDRNGPPTYVKGDPHFKTFGGEMYDFHGECDLVLVHNPDFAEGLGMDIHIRTKIEDFWSSVESAAMKIGSSTLEIKANEDSDEWLWVNGELLSRGLEVGKWHTAEMEGFLLRFKETSGSVREANLYMKKGSSKEHMVFKTFKSFVRVDVDWTNPKNFQGSTGLLGAFDQEGLRVARDGATPIKDAHKFGQEWQVNEAEPQLFHSYEGAVVGQKCIMPPTYTAEKAAAMKRRLRASNMTEEDAKKACDHLSDPEEIQACVFDVLATQDLSMASAW